jgi:hypothetical protein
MSLDSFHPAEPNPRIANDLDHPASPFVAHPLPQRAGGTILETHEVFAQSRANRLVVITAEVWVAFLGPTGGAIASLSTAQSSHFVCCPAVRWDRMALGLS